jgi:hypothetical protein
MMMQPTHFWDLPDRAHLWPLDRPWHRTIHGQTPVRAPVMVVLKVLGQESHEMSFVQNDHVVQAFTANTPDQPLNIRILPRTSWGDHDFLDHDFLDPQMLESVWF